MQEIKTYADITKAANAMQKEREIAQYSPLTEPDRFEQAFYDVFCGDEVTKPVNTSQALIDAGHSIHDF